MARKKVMVTVEKRFYSPSAVQTIPYEKRSYMI